MHSKHEVVGSNPTRANFLTTDEGSSPKLAPSKGGSRGNIES